MKKFPNSELLRFKELEDAQIAEFNKIPTNALAASAEGDAWTPDLSEFRHDLTLAYQAAHELVIGSPAGLLRFLCEAKSDRLPYLLREALVASLNGRSFIQLDVKVAAKKKGLTPQKVRIRFSEQEKIKKIYIINNGLKRRKDGLEAICQAMCCGKSTAYKHVSTSKHQEWVQELDDWRDSGKNLVSFLKQYEMSSET